MAYFSFSPICDLVVITVKCPKCGHIESYGLQVPMANFYADTHSESQNVDSETIVCSSCGNELEVDLSNGICGGDGDISDLDKVYLLGVDEHFPDEDWDDIPEDVFKEITNPHVQEIKDVLDKLDGLDELSRTLLYRNLFANVISALEAYLSDTAIKKIMNDDYYKRKFVESSLKRQNDTFKLSDFYKIKDDLDNRVSQWLRDLIYHKLDVVKPLYKDAFGVDLGDIGKLMKAVQIRHDIVHRNGKDKDGNLRNVTKENVKELISEVSSFIENIENQFYVNEFEIESMDSEKIELPF